MIARPDSIVPPHPSPVVSPSDGAYDTVDRGGKLIGQNLPDYAPCPYCDKQGWPILDGMCHNHYRWLVCQSLRYGADRAEMEWADAIDKVYRVECALGLRAAPNNEFTAEDRQEISHATQRNLAPRRVSRPKPASSQDFI